MDIQRLFLILGLAVTAYLLVLQWNEDYGQKAHDQAATAPEPPAVTDTAQAPSQATDDIPTAPAPAQAVPTEDDDIPSLELDQPSAIPTVEEGAASQLVHVKTDVFDILIDLHGGDIVRLALPAYPTSLETPDIPFPLLDSRNAYEAQSGLIGPNGTDSSGQRPTFSVSRDSYDLGSAEELIVPLYFTQADGTEIVKKFHFRRGDYLIKLSYQITNKSASPWRGGLFAQIKRNSQPPVSESNNVMGMQPYTGGATRNGDERYYKLEFDDLEEESYKHTATEGYMAMVQHYFVSAWVPEGEQQVSYFARQQRGRDVYLFGYTTGPAVVRPGETGMLAGNFYAGPKDQYRLQEIAAGLDLTVDYGFLWWLAQPLFFLLTLLYDVVPNWGLAIIGLTIVVKLVLYPLSAASYKSMAKMRKLQPEMTRLKERFGDDRQKFSQAMMELYKKEGANPLGGCLPILLQMPVFLALYWTLMESVELRQAPFVFWIKDLSAMDPYFVLPILMGISMYLTQRMQPEPPDPLQAKVFKFMPIMFTFFFLWFPSGLVLYWLVNNILSILQQWYVTRQIVGASSAKGAQSKTGGLAQTLFQAAGRKQPANKGGGAAHAQKKPHGKHGKKGGAHQAAQPQAQAPEAAQPQPTDSGQQEDKA